MAKSKFKKPIYRVTLVTTTEEGTTVPVTLFRRKEKKPRPTVQGCCMKVPNCLCSTAKQMM